MVLWVDDPATIYTNDTAPFFDAFAEYITIKRFNYSQVSAATQATGHFLPWRLCAQRWLADVAK
jgi:hypothetical protein